MAFKALPPATRGPGRQATDTLNVAAFKANNGKGFSTSFSLPRALLREAGLPDYPGATFDIMIGEGADAGSVAIIDGTRFTAQKVGNSKAPNRVAITSGTLAAAALSTAAAEHEIGRGQIIVHMPRGFQWRAEIAPNQPVQLGAAA